MALELTEGQKTVLAAKGHLLVLGGPGSGKTTVSILKAAMEMRERLGPEQRVLFLSFARATISRVLEAIREEPSVGAAERRRIEVETYHSFFWQIIVTHGYLIGLPRKLSLLTPPNEAIALSAIRAAFPRSKPTKQQQEERAAQEDAERWRLARNEGKICFDLFGTCVAELLSRSEKVGKLIANRYPAIILDEFQDTNKAQWDVVKSLGRHSRLIASADPDQRIFDFIGADPERLKHFEDAFAPEIVDLSTDNHRSKGTEIALFGNHILTGKYKDAYTGVEFGVFVSNEAQAFAKLRGEVMAARGRLAAGQVKDWSVAVLVPTKKMMRIVSDHMRVKFGNMPPIQHTASIDMDGVILSAEVIAYLLQPGRTLAGLVEVTAAFFRGRNGNQPTKDALAEADRLESALHKAQERGAAGKERAKASIMNAVEEVLDAVFALSLSGDPDTDWQSIRALLESGNCARLKQVAAEARNIRLLEKGTVLRQALSADWRAGGAYGHALEIVRRAFVEEHFASGKRPERGVIVMNMHKAKGKQFDEVVIFEGWPRRAQGKIVANPDRIVRSNERIGDLTSARQNFRVSVTRSKRRTTILTPESDPCVLLLPANDG